MNIGMLKMLMGSLGIDGAVVEKQIASVVGEVNYMATEIAAQGAMVRAICKHLDLPVIPQPPLAQEIEHDGNG